MSFKTRIVSTYGRKHASYRPNAFVGPISVDIPQEKRNASHVDGERVNHPIAAINSVWLESRGVAQTRRKKDRIRLTTLQCNAMALDEADTVSLFYLT